MTLHHISKFEKFFIIEFSYIPIYSLFQSDFKGFHWKHADARFACYFITFNFTATLRRLTVTLFCYNKNNDFQGIILPYKPDICR